jgi:ABC-type nitrate/sulfonate/bicarbonate transport system substrate-binding protein
MTKKKAEREKGTFKKEGLDDMTVIEQSSFQESSRTNF